MHPSECNHKNATISSFVGAFPINSPRYILLVVVDEPKGNARTFNFSTGGWVAAPAVGRVIQGMAPLLGIVPERLRVKDVPDKSIASIKKYNTPRKLKKITRDTGALLKKRSGISEVKLLEKIRVILETPDIKRKAWKARSIGTHQNI